jgi:hypothetical protein
MDSDQTSSDMGVAGSLTHFIVSMFKDHYKDQIIGLMNKIIEDAPDSPFEIPRDDDDTTREANLKKNMKHVRGLSPNNTWYCMISACLHHYNLPVCDMIKHVLDWMYVSPSDIGVTDTLCMVTFVTDVCIDLVKKSNRLDSDDEEEMVERRQLINNVDQIIELFTDYVADRNMFVFRDFLFWLDSDCK